MSALSQQALVLIQASRNQPDELKRLMAIVAAFGPQWAEMARRKQTGPEDDRVRAILAARLSELGGSRAAAPAAPRTGPIAGAYLATPGAYLPSPGAYVAKSAVTPQIRARVLPHVVAAHQRAQAAVAARRIPGAYLATPGAYLPSPGAYVAKAAVTAEIRARVLPHVVAAHQRAQAAVAARRIPGAYLATPGAYLPSPGAYVAKAAVTPEIRARVLPHVVAAHQRAQTAVAARRIPGAYLATPGAYLPSPGAYVAKAAVTPEIRARVLPHVVAAHQRAQAAVAARRIPGAYLATPGAYLPSPGAYIARPAVTPDVRARAVAGAYLATPGAYLPSPGAYVAAKPATLTPEIRAKVTAHVVAAHQRAQAAWAASRQGAEVQRTVSPPEPEGKPGKEPERIEGETEATQPPAPSRTRRRGYRRG